MSSVISHEKLLKHFMIMKKCIKGDLFHECKNKGTMIQKKRKKFHPYLSHHKYFKCFKKKEKENNSAFRV